MLMIEQEAGGASLTPPLLLLPLLLLLFWVALQTILVVEPRVMLAIHNVGLIVDDRWPPLVGMIRSSGGVCQLEIAIRVQRVWLPVAIEIILESVAISQVMAA